MINLKKKNVVSRQEQIDDIMDSFNFDAVSKCMVLLEWGWSSSEGKVPNIFEIKKEARRLLRRVDVGSINTGGFKVAIDEDNCLSLEFIIDDWCGYDSRIESTVFTKE
jgi:hypothetical protein